MFAKYERYKDSGVEWLGEIPVHWVLKPLKRAFLFEKGKDAQYFTAEYIGNNPGEFPVYSGQTENNGVLGTINSFNYDYEKVIFVTTVGAKAMTPKLLTGRFSLSQNCLLMLQCNNATNITFFFYQLFPLFVGMKRLISSHMQESLRVSDIKNYIALFPPKNEQFRIATFLDQKTAEIDQAIAKKQRLIDLLKDQKAILINRAVTQGLNPGVPMKNSGVEWIGEIPAHWSCKRVKYLFTQSRLSPKKGDGVVTAFRDGQVTLRTNRRADGYTIAILEHGYQGVRKEQLVLNSMDAFAGAIGVSESDGKCSPEYVVCNPVNTKEILPKYYAFLLREMALANYIFVISPAVRQRALRIRYNNLASLFLPLPPYKEQKRIVDFVDKQNLQIENVIHTLLKEIKKLQEFKQTLIAHAVTGKIKV